MQVQKRTNKKKRQIHPRWMGKLGVHVSFEEFKEVKVWCETCDASTWHSRVLRYMKQLNYEFLPCDYPTSKQSILLKCNRCGRLEKNIKKLAYGLNHYGGIK